MNQVERISYEYFVRQEVLRASSQIMGMRTASTKALYQKWASPQMLRVVANLGRWLKQIPSKFTDSISNAWQGVKGNLQRFVELFKDPKIITALTNHVKEVTPKNLMRFVEEGKKALKKVFSTIRALLMHPSGMPTLTDLVKKTAVGAGIFDWFEKNVRPRADVVDDWLKKNLPNLRRPLIAAIFAFIWFNVDELTWEWADLVQGFTGAISLASLLTSLPESIIGFLTGRLFGVGFTIMPYMIAGRILWLASKKYLEWNGKEWLPNWRVVDKNVYLQVGPHTVKF